MTYVIDYDQAVPAWTLPTRFEAAFAARWYTDLTDPAVVWTDLRGRFIAADNPTVVSWSRGRSMSSGEMARTPQPGSLSVRLDSADGALTPDNPDSPYYPNVAPGLPVRWSVFDGSSWRVEFTGFVTDVNPAMLGGVYNWTQVDVSATDGWSRVMQAGQRLAYRDRVLTDLAAPRPVELLLDTPTAAVTEAREGVGLTTWAVGSIPDARDAWGLAWLQLDAGGVVDWSVPGAAGVVGEVGRGERTDADVTTTAPYTTGSAGSSGFASDRFGGGVQPFVIGGQVQLSDSCSAAYNLTRQQITVGRPPQQLLPASAYDPASVAASGVTVEGSGTLSLVAPLAAGRSALDPVTGARTPVTGRPAKSYQLAGTGSVVFGSVPVTAGSWYAGHVSCSGTIGGTLMRLRWLNGAGATISETVGTATRADVQVLGVVGQAPAGAVAVRAVVVASTTPTVLYAPGVYPAVPTGVVASPWAVPARWWATGASAHLVLFAQWPGGLTTGSDAEWLHYSVPVDSFADGAPHMVAWNVDPGVNPGAGGVPTVWVDGVATAGAWEVSSNDGAAPQWAPSLALGAGLGTVGVSSGGTWSVSPATVVSTVTPYLVLTGSPRALNLPSQALLDRWTGPYGAPAVWPQPVTAGGRTDLSMESLLDALGWPTAMRDLSAGKATLPVSWVRLVGDDDGTAATSPGDYSSDITALAEAEFGWADVDGTGFLRWLPRGWYDPDGDGVAEAVAAFSWNAADSGTITYTTALTQEMGEDDVINQVLASAGDGSSLYTGAASMREDVDSQDRIGVRRGEFANAAWTTQADTDSITAEVIGLYGTARLLATQVVVACFGADDPFLAPMLALNPADPVAVTVPRAPAPDVTLGCLLLSKAVTTDGLVTTFTLTLGPCPVPVLSLLYPATDLFPALDLYPIGA